MSREITIWYVRDPEGGIEEYTSEAEAFGAAHALLDHYRENAVTEGWPSDIDCLEWGVLTPRESAKVETESAPEGSSFDTYWSVHLEPTLPKDEKEAPKRKWSFNDEGFESHVDLGDVHNELKARP